MKRIPGSLRLVLTWSDHPGMCWAHRVTQAFLITARPSFIATRRTATVGVNPRVRAADSLQHGCDTCVDPSPHMPGRTSPRRYRGSRVP